MDKIPKIEDGNRFVIGIDGLSRSGKTTFTRQFKDVLQEKNVSVCIFHIDDYIVERNRRYKTDNEEWIEYYFLQWDVEWLKNNFFKKLKISKKLHLPIYNNEFDTHKVHSFNIPDTCLIIIEGVFLQRREWKNFYDFVFYIDCQREKRYKRESLDTQRNIEKFRKRYWKAEEYYIKIEVPMKQADLILHN